MSLSEEANKFQEEQNRDIRALQVLGFSFPPDGLKTAEALLQLPPEHVLILRMVYKEKFESYKRVFDSFPPRITESICQICDRDKMAFDDLPDGWGWLKMKHDKGYMLMCDECQFRYIEKFNEEPNIVKEPEWTQSE